MAGSIRSRRAAVAASSLVLSVALSVFTGSGVSGAAEVPEGAAISSEALADGEFFVPGADVVTKVDPELVKDSGEVADPLPDPSGFSGARYLKNVRTLGNVCGTKLLQQTSGRGKTTLVMSFDKAVAATTKRETAIDLNWVSAGVGWDVTKSYNVKNETRYEVPAGKFGVIQAYPFYRMQVGDVWQGFSGGSGRPTGYQAYAYKPVGVCFNQYLQ
ncbi:hypothetical protein [Streptomyces sp. NPDC093225]|uniref:hypothetical protein n=1 Tax=Streptomyces sp. NPDC093225 TaxID=3366034 RepID=UPI00381E48F3